MPTNIKATINNLIVNKIIEENAATGDKSPTAQRMQDLAIPAIIAGQRDPQGAITPEWRAYMTFLLTGLNPAAAADPNDLRRLLPEDGSVEAERQQERCYVLGNGMCGTTTGEAVLDGGTTDHLDS